MQLYIVQYVILANNDYQQHVSHSSGIKFYFTYSAYAITKIYKDVISNMQDQIYGERLHYIELTYFQ